MVEMMADGVEVDMNFRDGAPEITRYEIDRRQVDGVRVMVTKRGHRSPSASHFITLIKLIVCLLSTPQTAEASCKITTPSLCAFQYKENKITTKRTKTAISAT